MRAAALVVPLLLAGCATGSQVGPLPAVSDPGRAATVIVARSGGLGGYSVTATVTVDGAAVYELGREEHARILVPAGERMIGVKTSERHPKQVIQAEPGEIYYFRVVGIAELERVTEAEGQQLVQQTAPAVR